ncbi:YybH family protein [Stratiformator vulcanicus]|uniref:SnoaL-like domain protein n=1 Tax=Stratiformator vulcanicus TaxID=2527980 RepID=A0A517QYD8_9PLAN|nr:nuclear transport factor 2 family protein [Stratiformator vulcanicus]QDT36667.1 SnoaL-like domain protein [Stratiformator vulcanicus]
MKSLPSLAALLLFGAALPHATADDPTDRVRSNVAAYVEAFNAHDASKAAGFWSEVGCYRGPDGTLIEGREAIRTGYAGLFESSPDIKIEVDVLAIRQTSPSVILEQGTATLLAGEDVKRDLVYKATHIRTSDGWKLDSVNELDAAAGGEHQTALEPLSFLIGNWVDDGGDFKIKMTCIWSKNRHSLLRKFEVVSAGTLELEGTQIIAWDPRREEIRSWLFDSEGGIGKGTWERSGDRWIVTNVQTQGDGSLAAAVNTITPLDDDRYLWQSTEREVGGRLLPDIAPVTVVRKGASENADPPEEEHSNSNSHDSNAAAQEEK